ncbi:hypothetical protein L6164_016683 [Bauhinia variegata]|uniref:Uncharacterized protein n=1 Tax=Bauhinia variegata TaxID=167791 RepID=A0ACB9NS02_BAUVA|nr:hypothetical protein L6164_016683 [Bauhinia variegata]
MACETPKEAWDKLKQMLSGSERTRHMEILNLKREFEVLRMNDDKSIKAYADRFMEIINKIRLLGVDLSDERIVEKVLVSLPERSLEDSKDLSKITLAELVHAFPAQELRRSMRQGSSSSSEGAFLANQRGKSQSGEKKFAVDRKRGDKKKLIPRKHCNRTGHPEEYCWYRPGFQCNKCKKPGHPPRTCKSQKQQAQVAEDQPHQTEEENLDIDQTYHSTVKVGNGENIQVKGRGVLAVETQSGIPKFQKHANHLPHEQDVAVTTPENGQDEDSDADMAVRGTRPLSDVYGKCNTAVNDCSWFAEAVTVQDWLDAANVTTK